MKLKYLRESDLTNSAMDAMINSLELQNDAEVGPFWYDPIDKELFGVSSISSSAVQFYKSKSFNHEVKTSPKLHQDIWRRQLQKNKYSKHPDKRFHGDYTNVPRGRVFEFKDVGYVVYVGNWINDYPEVKEIIINEFNLPEDTKFSIDSHWDIGHGWSQELI